MRRLNIDMGNSSTKVAVFDGYEIIHHQKFEALAISDLESLINRFSISKSIISTVNQEISLFEDFLKKHTQYTRFSTFLTKGVQNKYKTPATLGLDRWAGILGASRWFPGSSVLVIDSGTCITYDFLTAEKEYFGGSISPGIAMRFKALHEFTERLPLINWDMEAEIPDGTDTTSAITHGVLRGILNEIEGFIAINNKKTIALNVILTGGDANFLYKQLQNSIFAPQIIKDPHLVLKGLNEAITD